MVTLMEGLSKRMSVLAFLAQAAVSARSLSDLAYSSIVSLLHRGTCNVAQVKVQTRCFHEGGG